jgi:two-component system, cell cycle sensor histidine kinase and response regulator CckA
MSDLPTGNRADGGTHDGARAGAITVLLVEDEPAVRRVVARTLRHAGYRVLEAGNGEDALAVVDANEGAPIDVLLTDVLMPKLSGRELADRLSDRLPATRVIFMSGYTAGEIDYDALSAPSKSGLPRGFLQKPFTPDVLLDKLREALSATAGSLGPGSR